MRNTRTARADAIVLRRGDYGETDRLITLYTLQRGKVRTIAKGVRRITSRMAGHLDLLTYSTVLLVQGRNLDLITQSQTVEGFPGLRGDVWRTTYACYAGELVDRFTEDNLPNPALFGLLVRTLKALATLEEAYLPVAVHAFELALLGLSGYQPELRTCLGCQEPLQPEINHFSAEAGGALCPRCGGNARARGISVDALKVLRNLQARPDTVVGRVRIPAPVMAEVQDILNAYIHRLLERQPRATGFIDTLTRSYDVMREQERQATEADFTRHSPLVTGHLTGGLLEKQGSLIEKIVSLCKRRGYIFPGSEIYGGINSSWDYGPLGVELKNNVKRAWWRAMVQTREDMVGLDAAIIMSPLVWAASGHLQNFTDPLVECKSCKHRFRADHLPPEAYGRCPNCGGELSEARQFNMMFKTFVGPVEEEAAVVYLRPETAQGIFANFQNVQQATRRRLPFGIAQIGKSFRNEISPGNFIYRSREFEQMECEYFCPPAQAAEHYEHWRQERLSWYAGLGIAPERLRLREHDREELSHYSTGTTDVEYLYPWGWGELEGIANRTDYDLRQHSQHSGKDLSYQDDLTGERYIPYVIEPAAGADRATLAFLLDAYVEEPDKDGTRVVLRFDKRLAPIKVAVLPLSKKEELNTLAHEVHRLLMPHWMTQYDETQSIGRRYRRQDEIGTPYCVTVDFDSLNDRAVTVRDRDTMEQVRVPIADLAGTLKERLDEC